VFLILIPILPIVQKIMKKYKDLRVMNLRNFLRPYISSLSKNFSSNFCGTSSALVMRIYNVYGLSVPKWIWFYGEYYKFGRKTAQFQTTKSHIRQFSTTSPIQICFLSLNTIFLAGTMSHSWKYSKNLTIWSNSHLWSFADFFMCLSL
jgi:hypothetical protein